MTALLLLLALAALPAIAQDETRPNVLFIAVDDMADWAGYLGGHPDVRTPNIDRLANRGFVFTQAHVASPICGPSRAALWTGMRPERTQVYTNVGNYTDYVPDATILPQHFMQDGYHVMGAGKLIHPTGNVVPEAFHRYGPGTGIVGGPFTAEELATENMDPTYTVDRGPGGLQVVLPMNGISTIDRPTNQFSTFDWGPVDLTDSEMPDGQIADWAVEQLGKAYDQPFFLAVGFYRPHQPFFVPRKYFEMYDEDTISLPPTIAGDLHDLPQAGKYFGLLPWSSGRHDTVMKHNQWKGGVRGYLAAITFADAQVGKVLDALDKSPYADNTIIVFFSDHGWHLGEKEHWGKHTPWQRSTHVPLVIVPAKNSSLAGLPVDERIDAPVNLLDLYPTLIDLCGLSPRADLDGQSLAPLLKDPRAPWRGATVSTVGRGTHSVRTKAWRYIRYYDGSEELYDTVADPNEWFNLASEEKYDAVKARLAGYIVEDDAFRQFVRMGPWKAVFEADGNVMLFDMLGPAGISEQRNVAAEHPEIVREIRRYLAERQITDRYVTIQQ